jgi:II/X family phage/plasmid replication protein
MIDWVTATLPFSSAAKVFGGRVISMDSDGVVEWQSEKSLPVVGSYDAKMHVIARGDNMITIHGNPCKFIQGHNLFGSDDLVGLVTEVMKRICKALAIPVVLKDLRSWLEGNYQLNRVDIAYMYSLGSRANVKAWLRAAEFQSKSRHGRPLARGTTVYWGKHSRRWAIKAYGKADEISSTKEHKLPPELPHRDRLADFAEDKLRIELVLRSMQLKDLPFLKLARMWYADVPAGLHAHFLGSIDMSDQFTLPPETVRDLKPRLVGIYRLWENGEDLRAMYPKNSFYRYRRELLAHGIDIAIVQPKRTDNVVPLVRALRPQAMADVPQWARDTELYFEPKRKVA